jgi:hypothetical protein
LTWLRTRQHLRDPLDNLLAATQLREELLACWRGTHLSWDETPPQPLSQYMCRYTAELVTMLDPRWRVVLGLVDGHTHAWNERVPTTAARSPLVLDLTADQFARPPVLLTDHRPPGYVPHLWTTSDAGPYRARARAWRRQLAVRSTTFFDGA